MSGVSLLIAICIIALLVFSALMFLDCIIRKKSDFKDTFGVQNGEYDKLIWLLIIILSAELFGIGAIAYYFLVRKQIKDS